MNNFTKLGQKWGGGGWRVGQDGKWSQRNTLLNLKLKTHISQKLSAFMEMENLCQLMGNAKTTVANEESLSHIARNWNTCWQGLYMFG